MIYSYRWLASYFAKPLPPAEEVVRLLTLHFAEVEKTIALPGDTLLEVKILPDRTHDCLSHRGLAREIGALLNEPVLLPEKPKFKLAAEVPMVPLKIEATKEVRRAVSQVVANARIMPAPTWLTERLAVLGQRAINNVVDATNFVMYDLGQPVHAFDLTKVKGEVVIRRAQTGEKLLTLDDREIFLDDSMLVIADEEGPLDLAGIKGGKRAGITEYTQRLLLTACTFDPTLIRQAAKRTGLNTDAAKRFAQGLSPALAAEALDELILLILSFGNEDVTLLGERSDNYLLPHKPTEIRLVARDINDRLGIKLEASEIKRILERLNFQVVAGETGLAVTAPPERLDIKWREDVVEEIGRIYGYYRLPSKAVIPTKAPANIEFHLLMAVKTFLAERGFTEIYDYTFAREGEAVLENPLSAERPYLRTSLSAGLTEALKFNREHTLFDHEVVKLFEWGNVFTSTKETTRLALGLNYKNAKAKTADTELDQVLAALWTYLGIDAVTVDKTDLPDSVVAEFDWSAVAAKVKTVPEIAIEKFIIKNTKFIPYSFYPRIVRDVALFVPVETLPETVEEKIKKLAEENAGELLVVGPILFDTFEKGDKKSLAFRLVFQALDRTLTDDEVNEIMSKVTEHLSGQNGWQIR